jgi:hypothetical protein
MIGGSYLALRMDISLVGFLYYLESSEMWFWRRMEISGADRVKNEEVLQTVKEKRKTNWIGHILRRKCLLKHFIERMMEG